MTPDQTNKSQSPSPSKKRNWLSIAGRVLGILFVIAISLTIFSLSDKIEELKGLGYLGAFAIMLLGNATIILPAPGLTIVFALGSALNPVLLGLAAGTGAALGELTGYLAGFSGRAVIENRELYQRFENWMTRYGAISLFVLAVIPNPFFDLAGVVAGALKYRWWRFLILAWLGKTIQSFLVACAGAGSADWVLDWLKF